MLYIIKQNGNMHQLMKLDKGLEVLHSGTLSKCFKAIRDIALEDSDKVFFIEVEDLK